VVGTAAPSCNERSRVESREMAMGQARIVYTGCTGRGDGGAKLRVKLCKSKAGQHGCAQEGSRAAGAARARTSTKELVSRMLRVAAG